MKEFKGRCSSLGTLIQVTSLTDKQLEDIAKYEVREKLEGKAGLTDNMKAELDRLRNKLANPELIDGAKTLLREHYSYKIGLDRGRIFNESIQKGIMMEDESIELTDRVIFGEVGLVKNPEFKSNDFIEGTCDIKHEDWVLDTKTALDTKTFHEKALTKPTEKQIWQLKGYAILYKKSKAILVHTLVNTPTWACLKASHSGRSFDQIEYECTYEHIPEAERVIAYNIPIETTDEVQIEKGIGMCRDYLTWYDGLIKSMIGNVNNI